MTAGGKRPYKGDGGSGLTGAPRRVVEQVAYTVRGARGRRSRTAPAPAPASNARPISDICTDGGTRFGLSTDPARWHPEFRRLVDWLRREQRARETSDGDGEREEIPTVILPMPPLPSPVQRGLAGVLQEGEGTTIDWRERGFGGAWGLPIAEVELGGRTIAFHFRDRCFVRLLKRHDETTGKTGWYFRVEAKHRELYGRGVGEWMRTWLGYFSWLTTGSWLEPVALYEGGWSTTCWHLNVDFAGLEWVWEDTLDVTAVRKRKLFGRHVQDDDDALDDLDDEDGDDEDVDDDDADTHIVTDGAFMQTFELGRGSSDVQVVGYRKGDEQREAKGIQPEKSAYATSQWIPHGWQPDVDGDPFRVEIRARKKGLVYRHVERDEIVLDFRNPALLCDPESVRTFWAYVTGRRRFVQRTGSRLRRCPTDARWLVVQSAARRPSRADIRQMPHEVARVTRTERVLKARRRCFDALQDLAMVEHGVAIIDPMDFAAALRELAARVERGAVQVDRLGDGVLAHAWRPSNAIKRKPDKVQFFVDELEPADAYQDELRRHGGAGGLTLEELLADQQRKTTAHEHQSSGTVGQPRGRPRSTAHGQGDTGGDDERRDEPEVHEEGHGRGHRREGVASSRDLWTRCRVRRQVQEEGRSDLRRGPPADEEVRRSRGGDPVDD